MVEGTSINQAVLLATPKSQNRGVTLKSRLDLSKSYNEESGVLAKPLRARIKAVIFVVVSFVNGTTIPYETRLESNRFNSRRRID